MGLFKDIAKGVINFIISDDEFLKRQTLLEYIETNKIYIGQPRQEVINIFKSINIKIHKDEYEIFTSYSRTAIEYILPSCSRGNRTYYMQRIILYFDYYGRLSKLDCTRLL